MNFHVSAKNIQTGATLKHYLLNQWLKPISLLINGAIFLSGCQLIPVPDPNAPKLVWMSARGTPPPYEDDADCQAKALTTAQLLSGCDKEKRVLHLIACKAKESLEESSQYSNCMKSKGHIQKSLSPNQAASFMSGQISSSNLQGSNSDETISAAQKRLKELGYNVGNVNGRMNKKTEAAIGNFQRNQGLPVNNQLDPATLFKLGL
jgi:hypothetical protein